MLVAHIICTFSYLTFKGLNSLSQTQCRTSAQRIIQPGIDPDFKWPENYTIWKASLKNWNTEYNYEF